MARTKNHDGWMGVELEGGIRVMVRLGHDPASRSTVVTGVLIEADEVTTDTLRAVQPARLLAAISEDEQMWGERPEGTSNSMVHVMALHRSDDDRTTIGELRSRPTSTVKASKRRPLGRPDGGDDFYRRFAKAYQSATVETSKPAILLASENDVPVETVRRWTQEARRRGHLAPARKGRAG